MVVTTMAKTSSLSTNLATDFPDLHFASSDDFYWSPSDNTVYFPEITDNTDRLTLLHEVAHAALGHAHFKRDIDLLKIERDAWEYVRDTLAPRYNLTTPDETIENAIDTYREWLHARSKCPICAMTGIQTDTSLYHCLSCDQDWRVNEARRCGLKRYSLPN